MIRVASQGVVGLATTLLAVGAVVGCEKRETEQAPAEAPTSYPSATLEGFVVLAHGDTLPQLRPPEHQFPDGCPPYEGDRDGRPVSMVGDRRLAGVLVNVTDYDAPVAHEARARNMAIEDCRLSPRLVSATLGDTLEVTNASKRAFWPSLEGDAFTQALLPEQTRAVELTRGRFRKIQCGFDEPCGLAWVVTLLHPLHTVSDEAGAFRIEGVPAGQELTVSAFHPVLRRPAVATMTLRPGETRRLELEMNPAGAVSGGAASSAPAPESSAD